MVRKFKARRIGRRVLKVDDNQLLVLVGGQEERRLSLGFHSQEIAVLRLYYQ